MSTLREKLAASQHAIWAYWMKYMFGVGQFLTDGTWLMPADKVERWQRQMNTPFEALSEQEQASDLRQADKVIKAMAPSKREKVILRHGRYYAALKADGVFREEDDCQLRTALTRMIVA